MPILAAFPAEPVLFTVLLVEVAAMFRNCVVGAAFLCWVPGLLIAAEGIPPAPSESVRQQVAVLVVQLAAPEFSQRQDASQQLEEIGAPAFEQLESAVCGGNRETSARALAILKRHHELGEDGVKPAAREVLQRLATHSSASTAQRARDVLTPPAQSNAAAIAAMPVMPPPRMNWFGNPPAIPVANRAALNPFPPALVTRRVSVSDINGQRLVEIDDRERNVKLNTAQSGAIHVEIADKQNAANATRKLDANDLNELKRKDAELGRLYEQFYGEAQLPRVSR